MDEEAPKLVSKAVKLDQLVKMMQTPKDIRVVMAADGSYTATCKKCNASVLRAIKDEPVRLSWWKCPKCERMTFGPLENYARDAKIAETMGGKLEYELYFFKEIPAQLVPPTEWQEGPCYEGEKQAGA